MRTVAAEAGCSLGRVQRLMGDKDALLAAAMHRVVERVEERVGAQLAGDLTPRAFIEALARVLIDDDRRDEGMIWVAFAARALVTPALADQVRRQQDEAVEIVASVLRAAQARGELAATVSAENEAAALLALIDGLGLAVMLNTMTAGLAHTIVDTYLDRLVNQTAEPDRAGAWPHGHRPRS